MKAWISFLFFMVAAWMPMQAHTIYTLSTNQSPVEFTIGLPEHYDEDEDSDECGLDLLFQDPEDEGRTLAFHFFQDSDFATSSIYQIYDYTDWLMEQLGRSVEWKRTAISTSKDNAVVTFRADDDSSYCNIYVGKIGKDIIFASLATSSLSTDHAIRDNNEFLKEIYWKE